MSQNLRGLLFGAFAASVVAALLDAFVVTKLPYGEAWLLVLAIPFLSLVQVLWLFVATFIALVLVGLSLHWAGTSGFRGKVAPGLPVLGAAVAVGGVYQHLAVYAEFATYPPAIAGCLALFVAVLIACSGRLGLNEPQRWRVLRPLSVAVPVLALVGAVGAHVATYRMHVDDYPTLRLALVQIAHLLLVIAFWHASRRLPAGLLARAIKPWPVIVLAVGYGALSAIGVLDIGRPLFLARTTLGTALFSLYPYSVEDERAQRSVSDDADGPERFLRHAQMPELPEGFKLQDYNVLFVMAEATRLDQTSLVHKKRATTPKLAAFRDSGAFFWTKAFSPSSGTFLSLSSIFGLSYPSMLKLETWQKPWTGRLREPKSSPVPQFKKAGYKTFWISHNKARCFKKTVIGFDEGYDDRVLVRTTYTTDKSIADTAISMLKKRAKKRFFGFVFFVSPHSSYDTHYESMPSKTKLDRYRQEIRFMDHHVGRVLKALDQLKLSDKTIVIFSSDHGEEFGDHGGYYHKSTVYQESLNVPLLIRVPGLSGVKNGEPTSLTYVLPWLMLHGSEAMKTKAERRMREHFGPMLLHTGGAVVSEVLGHDRMKSTLIYKDLKLNYDFRSQRTEVYRFDKDPREQHDLFLKDLALATEAQRRIAAYRDVRASRRKFALRPDKLDPREKKK